MSARNEQTKISIAHEAARIMVEGGIEDYSLAKRKAAQRLGKEDARLLPANDEVERALEAYQRLFRGAGQRQHLRHLREQAVAAMRFLAAFKPRLAGPVLSGTADEHSAVTLHLFAESPEEVAMFLIQEQVRFESGERRLRLGQGAPVRLSTFGFVANGAEIELVVFSGRYRRQPPIGPVNGRPMERAGLARVEALLLESDADALAAREGGTAPVAPD